MEAWAGVPKAVFETYGFVVAVIRDRIGMFRFVHSETEVLPIRAMGLIVPTLPGPIMATYCLFDT